MTKRDNSVGEKNINIKHFFQPSFNNHIHKYNYWFISSIIKDNVRFFFKEIIFLL